MTDIIPKLGKFRVHPDIEDWLISEPQSVPFFEDMKLPFIITDGDPSQIQLDLNEAVLNFLNKSAKDRGEITALIFKNYTEFVDAIDHDPLKLTNEENIWDYVHPKEIYIIQRPYNDKFIYIQICCECDWEQEHGLQLVFQKGQRIVRVSEQDGHLTKADAWNLEDSEDEMLMDTV